MFAGSDYYVDDYEESRARFRELTRVLQAGWPQVSADAHPLTGSNKNLTIDIIKALPRQTSERLLVITTGLHGIEGYVGAAVQRLFVSEYAPRLNPDNTGLVLVHAINPWGMKEHRRVNENNVDLNRNFIYDFSGSGGAANPAYQKAEGVLQPEKPISGAVSSFFYLTLLNKILTMGPAVFRQAVLLGQYDHPSGMYYGGKGFEYSARVMIDLYLEMLPKFNSILFIDMHSGYGPRYGMTLVNSFYEQRDSLFLQNLYDYPLVAKADNDELYRMHGDMIDYLYRVVMKSYPGKRFYGTSFEFGTIGDSFFAVLKSLKAMIDENRLYHHGAANEKAARQARQAFFELFYPGEERWREKALDDARRAFNGVLKAEGYYS
jgi:hypothetical protein